jgi:cystathionine gamma-synthase
MDYQGLNSKLIHLGNPKDLDGAVMPSIVLSTTFERAEDQLNPVSDYIYSRYGNPNRNTLETKLANMDNGLEAVTFSSGLAAAQAVFHSLRKGDHVLIPDDIYFGVKKILMRLYADWDLHYDEVDMSDLIKLEASVKENTKLIWMESPSNPSVKLVDIKAIVDLSKTRNIFTVVDNTWATPIFTKPIDLGVDIVLYSTTKYFGGHSDVLGGAVIFKEANERYEFIRDVQKIGGAVPSPFDCWLLCRSLATFPLRMRAQSENAMKLAEYFDNHSSIEKVLYPGLTSDAGHEIALKQMKGGFGAMLSILVKGGREEALMVCKSLKMIKHATSLGGVESLIEHRKSIEGDLSPTPDNLLRVSVGIEEIEDIIIDFEQALKEVKS